MYAGRVSFNLSKFYIHSVEKFLCLAEGQCCAMALAYSGFFCYLVTSLLKKLLAKSLSDLIKSDNTAYQARNPFTGAPSEKYPYKRGESNFTFKLGTS